MYKVLLADDDYPVLELLAEAIDWEGLGFVLSGTYENGAIAWEHAQREMPDILITDIGMPKMDGLELSSRVKEARPSVRIAILSCHSEFQYAQQAMRLNVQEYLLKDALDPGELVKVLLKFKEGLDAERQTDWEQTRMRHLVNETKELRKEKFFRGFIQQPLLSADQWAQEAIAYGLFGAGEHCLPVIGYIENYARVRARFSSEQTLRFAVDNVMDELLAELTPFALHVGYDARRSMLLFAFKPGIKTNIYDQVKSCLGQIQSAMRRVLKIGMAFIVGEPADAPKRLKHELGGLVGGTYRRFYLQEGEIARGPAPVSGSPDDLFALYDRAGAEIREALMGKERPDVARIAGKWMGIVWRGGYPAESVKDWILKLVLDLKLKLHALLVVRSDDSADMLHKEIADIDSLWELGRWLEEHLLSFTAARGEGASGSKRLEVAEAYRYVSSNLGRRISLEEVAELLHLNASYFSRFFKKETGATFIEYVTKQKMERAKELLDQTGHSVGEICELLGYDNQSYFIKTFKAHAGVTPAEYRG
ncbi:helix-turn-helix domain-containing protein [Cohnella sp. 56]|uniref:helix-turn-helix domain-containing protein n=1 Tax=Cohnella sp. 56 TaxID=3113722 RepID=UPI0030EA95D8